MTDILQIKNSDIKIDMSINCVTCLSAAKLTCANCNDARYCSKEHQKDDWKKHKETCRPYSVKTNEILGRYLVAARDIKQGELIIKESPAVVGPQIESAPLCLNCYRPISSLKETFACQKCNTAPFCSPVCNSNGHLHNECSMFKSNPILTTVNLMQNCQIVMPLRCLLLKENSMLWKDLMELEAHTEKRRNTPIWRNHKINIEDVISRYEILTKEDLKNEIMQRICGILDVNTFELRAPGFGPGSLPNPAECVRGLYLKAALMAHDCIGNTHLAVDDNYNLIIHASIPIAKGSPIYFNYTNALQGTYERQDHLIEGKYFNCKCVRCSDPSECGTHMSSLKCVRCDEGMITPINPTEERYTSIAIWQCTDEKCRRTYRGSMINLAIQESQKFIDCLDKSDIRTVENALKKLLLTLSPGHAIILDIKQCLIGLHSEILRREINPNRKVLSRKLELCKEILPILEKIEPGISRLKGITLYEMHIPMVVIANKEYENGEISAEQLLKILLEGEVTLKKAINILLYEPNASPEGRLGSKAMMELKFLRNSIKSVQQIVENKKQSMEKRRHKKKNK